MEIIIHFYCLNCIAYVNEERSACETQAQAKSTSYLSISSPSNLVRLLLLLSKKKLGIQANTEKYKKCTINNFLYYYCYICT